MTARPLAPADAQTLWLAEKIPSDQVLIYGFDGVPGDLPDALATVARRAQASGDLAVRVENRSRGRYPAWVGTGVDDRLVVHEPSDARWAGCLAAAVALGEAPLNPYVAPWRLHVFPGVDGIPGSTGPGTVAAFHVVHALGDGTRLAALAAMLFGRRGPIPRARPPRGGPAAMPWRGVRAALAHREMVRDERSGVVPPPAGQYPLRRTNEWSAGKTLLRTVVRRRDEWREGPVTVTALAAVSEALARLLREFGDDPVPLGAEVPMAHRGPRLADNHYGNVAVDLHPEVPLATRAARIAADLDARRRRAEHPANRAGDLAFAAMPAPLLRWGVGKFDPTARSSSVTGNTVVTSVNRGAADLGFGGAPVVVTSDVPALSPMMGLVHGVHGIGDAISVSVHARESAIGGEAGLDGYVERLAAALRPSGA